MPTLRVSPISVLVPGVDVLVDDDGWERTRRISLGLGGNLCASFAVTFGNLMAYGMNEGFGGINLQVINAFSCNISMGVIISGIMSRCVSEIPLALWSK